MKIFQKQGTFRLIRLEHVTQMQPESNCGNQCQKCQSFKHYL